MSDGYDVYLSGPLFTPGDRHYLEQIDNLCRISGLKTYLPHRDAGLSSYHGKDFLDFFEKDIEAIKGCRIVIAVLNGLIDSGTAWEVGYAFSLGKEILGICEDTRIPSPSSSINLMLACSAKIVSTKGELEQELNAARKRLGLF